MLLRRVNHAGAELLTLMMPVILMVIYCADDGNTRGGPVR